MSFELLPVMIYMADMKRPQAFPALRAAVGEDLAARAARLCEGRAQFVAVMVGPGGRAVIPAESPEQLLDLQRLCAEPAARITMSPLYLEPPVLRLLQDDIAARHRRQMAPEAGHA